MEKKLNTTYTFEFCDGTTTEMTLTFYKLYQLKSKDRTLYDKYTKILSIKHPDELDMIEMLYVAYICAHLSEEVDTLMTFEEFMIKCGSDRNEMAKATKALMRPKKQQASANHS